MQAMAKEEARRGRGARAPLAEALGESRGVDGAVTLDQGERSREREGGTGARERAMFTMAKGNGAWAYGN